MDTDVIVVGAGLAGGVYSARFVQALLFEVEPVSASSLALPVLGLFGVALVAAWSPARRAISACKPLFKP